MFTRHRNAVLISAERQKVTAVQPERRVTDSDEKIKFFAQGGNFGKNALMVVLKRNNVQPVTRKRSIYFVPQIHKRFARIEKRTSDTKRFFRKAGSGTGFRDGIPGIRKKVFGMAVDHLTGGGQMQSLVSAVKQFHVQLFFQCVYLFHDRRCGQIKFFRCFVKTSAVSGTDKNSE